MTTAQGATPPDLSDEEDAPLVCSARGCRDGARWGVRWNNPRLHTPQRRKVWLACAQHRGTLEDYLQVRGFWKDTLPVADLTPDEGPGRPG